MSDLRNWLTELGLEQFFDTFVKEGVDLDIIPDLNDRELERLGLTLGQRKRLLRAAAALGAKPREETPPDPTSKFLSEAPAKAERRQITVLFCDLVESTQLAEMLGEEPFSDVIRAYQQMCAAAVQRFDGHLARYMGDGVLVYFGFPQAHEDDPQRAVRTALAIIEATITLNRRVAAAYGASAAVRIGIHTGPVVAGDLSASGSPNEVSGITPHIAARLQTFAAPNTIVIGPLTRDLLYNHFECTPLGPTELKGVSQPLPVFRVDGDRAVESRFSARAIGALTPMVGREPELSLTLERWEHAVHGEGQVVVLSGEPGIGKSRLVQSLRQHIGEAARVLNFQCSPYHSGSAFHPFIERLERDAKWSVDDSADRKLERLEAMLRADGEDISEVAPLIASMLMIPTGSRYVLPEMSPRQMRDRTIEAIAASVIGASKRRPVLLIFEDAHWADPTSLEVLEAIAVRLATARVMIVVTRRTDSAPLMLHVPVSNLVLNRLSKRERRDLALKVAAGRKLPEQVIGQIIDRTDGVPLFVEELTKMVLESGALSDSDGDDPLDRSFSLPLPPTLQDSLMARLDRLTIGKEVAQIGAVIGREFSFEVISALSPMAERELRGALAALVDSEIIVPSGPTERAGYTFKHALVQEAAYSSLLTGRRRELHGETAKVLIEKFPDTSRTQPEIIAHHFTESGNIIAAVGNWLQAGTMAGSRSANAEAVLHLTTGLRLLDGLPESPERDLQELDLLIAMGPALINTKGPGVPEVERTYARAVAVCARMPVGPKHFAVYWGQWRISATFEIKRVRADRLHAVAEKLGEPGFLLQANHAEWATLFGLGDQARSWERIEKGLALYESGDYRWHASIYGGHDAKVCALGEAGLAWWLRGFPDRAVGYADRALAWSRELAHAGSRAHALDYALMLHWFRRDARTMLPLATELIELADHQRFVDYQARGRVFRGWARATLGEIEAGYDEMRAGVDAQRSTATNEDLSFFLDMLAQGCAMAGRLEPRQQLMTEALAHARSHGVRHWLAELHRNYGDLLLAGPERDVAAGWTHLETARQIASDQGTKSLELRAAMSLARLATRDGDVREARRALAAIFETFVEGFATADLVAARALLDQSL